jgi:hypothetical protein
MLAKLREKMEMRIKISSKNSTIIPAHHFNSGGYTGKSTV